ncbi:1,4-alpha-glucan branching protein GlgB [Abiotrophia defectiva]|uniref:1,4-alpha-glucan branching enzyme GlgB n=1 Tax=Abiotrophia defectiva ATCC 49176 TaxID=592010 RepID=W1Q2W2_ABIDE|nr:1,4-alpha-glucan branching protein GlgB [Abiotrophia defectiva]ESK65457.1 1,4-alpha-glucan branching enzyme [Abiotrophia defectiva ATCC 49176]QKH47482.1 1,4-alpha-glucan branching protein GlgB [Abiotrophia defectiva]
MTFAALQEQLSEHIYHFNHGNHEAAYQFLGCHKVDQDGVTGYRFAIWAPHAANVYILGDFNHWQNEPLSHIEAGVWAGIIQGAERSQCYKVGIDHGNGHIEYKIDPFGFNFEIAPKDATVVWGLEDFEWSDQVWMNQQWRKNSVHSPLNIYEVHASSWRRHPDGRTYTFAELADSLIPYVKEMGYTHIEMMPLMDHPLDASWGYQITGYYAVCGRYGTLEEFKDFVNQAHQAGIGVIMDWVPGHFCRNANALAYYDGTPTFEYQDVNRANNVGWGTLNFDLGKNQVQSFLISNAMFWLKECHLDGLRVDAVSNMLYLDFDQGPWTPNEDGSNHNRQGVAFLQKLNTTIKDHLPHVLMIAEESTDWKGITHAVSEGGLGFDYKWNMGWMNDTLRFFETDPYYRPQNFRLITFVFMYQYNERYVLPFSHDEVVHGKKSLLDKIPGNRETQFETLRLLHGYMMAQPGKKLHFMGNELGQYLEWRYYSELEWKDLSFEFNREYQHYMKTLNHIGKDYKALHYYDTEPAGLTVLDADNVEQAVLTMMRQGKAKRDFLIIALNFIPVERQEYRIGVPYKGEYEVLLNSQMQEFGGRWTENLPVMKTEEVPHDGQPYSIVTTVPSLGVLYIKPKRIYGAK